MIDIHFISTFLLGISGLLWITTDIKSHKLSLYFLWRKSKVQGNSKIFRKAKPSQAKPSQAKPSQAKPRQAKREWWGQMRRQLSAFPFSLMYSWVDRGAVKQSGRSAFHTSNVLEAELKCSCTVRAPFLSFGQGCQFFNVALWSPGEPTWN